LTVGVAYAREASSQLTDSDLTVTANAARAPRFSLAKEKIRVLLLEGVNESAVV